MFILTLEQIIGVGLIPTKRREPLLLHNPNTFSGQAYLTQNRGSNNGWFPRDSISGTLAHQPPDPARQATMCR